MARTQNTAVADIDFDIQFSLPERITKTADANENVSANIAHIKTTMKMGGVAIAALNTNMALKHKKDQYIPNPAKPSPKTFTFEGGNYAKWRMAVINAWQNWEGQREALKRGMRFLFEVEGAPPKPQKLTQLAPINPADFLPEDEAQSA
jgi:hypothetical protein